MGEYLKKLTIATTISVLSLGTVGVDKALGATLFLGKYGFGFNSRDFISSSQKKIAKKSPITRRKSLINRDIISQNSASTKKIDSATQSELIDKQLDQKLDNLTKSEILNQRIQNNYQAFIENSELAIQNLEQVESAAIDEFKKYTDPNAINQDIKDRYQDLLEPKTEQLTMLSARKLLLSTDNEIGAEFDSGALDEAQMAESLALLQSQGWIEASPTQQQKNINFPLPLTISIGLLIAWRSYYVLIPMLKALWYSIDQSIIEQLRDKYGNPKVPESSASLHNKNFRELRSLAFKAEKIADEKFGSEEFRLYLRLKQEVERGINKYRKIGKSIKLLEVAIAAQSSFLKLESTESRFFSIKQQEFYHFVADNLENNVDKKEFINKIKRKLAEIIPLLNSEEGRYALQSYLKEVNTISQHNLGLNLLALFKKYKLNDFTLLRTISDIIKQLDAKDLLNHTSLKPVILEYLEVFEKIAPIIQISTQENSPETYALIMQYMGLSHRHKTASDDFDSLMEILRKWKKSHKSLLTIRNEYPKKKYRLPPEFSQDIPGKAIFEKYEKYLESMN